MTDQEKQELTERAAIEGQLLADVVIPRLRGEIWRASATTSAIVGMLVFSWYRSDFAALKTELRGNPARGPVQLQENRQQVTNLIQPTARGILEVATDRILTGELEIPGHGNLRRTDRTAFNFAGGPDGG